MKTVNVALFGVGAMGKMTARFLSAKNVNIVGAFSRTSRTGEDLGTVVGLERSLGVQVSSAPDEVLAGAETDVAVVATGTDLDSFMPIAEVCAKHKVNVVTIAEQAFFPMPFSPEKAAALDKLARSAGISILATGVQDIFWLHLPYLLTGACHSISGIRGTSLVNLDYYGPALLSQYPLGQESIDSEGIPGRTAEAGYVPIFGIGVEALASRLNLTVTHREFRHDPVYATNDLHSNGLEKVIHKGQICGVTEIYEARTQEDIDFRVEFTEKICEPGEHETIAWNIEGVPNLNLSSTEFPGEEATCASMENRIVDVIQAEPGFIDASRFHGMGYNRTGHL